MSFYLHVSFISAHTTKSHHCPSSPLALFRLAHHSLLSPPSFPPLRSLTSKRSSIRARLFDAGAHESKLNGRLCAPSTVTVSTRPGNDRIIASQARGVSAMASSRLWLRRPPCGRSVNFPKAARGATLRCAPPAATANPTCTYDEIAHARSLVVAHLSLFHQVASQYFSCSYFL